MMATEAGVGLGTALRSSLRGDSRTLLLSKPSEVASHAPPLGWELNLGANLQETVNPSDLGPFDKLRSLSAVKWPVPYSTMIRSTLG